MKKSKLIISIFAVSFCLLAAVFCVVSFVDAPVSHAGSFWDMQKDSGIGQVGSKFGSAGDPLDVRVVVVRIIKVFLSFVGLIITVYVIFGGYKWMTAGGNDDRVKEGKAQIKNGIIGLIIIITSYAIITFVTTCTGELLSGNSWYCGIGIGD